MIYRGKYILAPLFIIMPLFVIGVALFWKNGADWTTDFRYIQHFSPMFIFIIGLAIYQFYYNFSAHVETKENEIVRTIKGIFKKDIVEIPYSKIARIYRQRGTRNYDYLIEGDSDGKTAKMSLTMFNYKKIFRDVIPRVNKGIIDKDILQMLKIDV